MKVARPWGALLRVFRGTVFPPSAAGDLDKGEELLEKAPILKSFPLADLYYVDLLSLKGNTGKGCISKRGIHKPPCV